jgi:hypothetical protein
LITGGGKVELDVDELDDDEEESLLDSPMVCSPLLAAGWIRVAGSKNRGAILA